MKKITLVTDSRGHQLDKVDLLERLLLAEVTWLLGEMKMDNVIPSCLIETYLNGFKGYNNYTDDDLSNEWQRVESSWWKAYDQKELAYAVNPNDPIWENPIDEDVADEVSSKEQPDK